MYKLAWATKVTEEYGAPEFLIPKYSDPLHPQFYNNQEIMDAEELLNEFLVFPTDTGCLSTHFCNIHLCIQNQNILQKGWPTILAKEMSSRVQVGKAETPFITNRVDGYIYKMIPDTAKWARQVLGKLKNSHQRKRGSFPRILDKFLTLTCDIDFTKKVRQAWSNH